MTALRLYGPEEAGKDGYPEEWHRTIKFAVRERAGHRCVRCKHPYRTGQHGRGEWSPCDELCEHLGPVRLEGTLEATLDLQLAGSIVAQGAEVEALWRILTVHHLDAVKLNCRWWNLAALCQRCHLEIQGRVRLHQVYPWPHSEWFRPYAAGYYALVYLGEELTREQTEARLEELLALELAT